VDRSAVCVAGVAAVALSLASGGAPSAAASTTTYAYVTYGTDTVSVIKTSTKAVVTTVTVGSAPEGVAIT
jgi:YVTN family beta-propeller protein